MLEWKKAGWLALLLVAGGGFADTPVRPVLVGIFATDYEATVRWYGQNFGFSTTREVTNDAGNLRIGFLDNGAFELEVYADIVRAAQAPRLVRDRFGMPGEGFVKLSLLSDDLAALAGSLKGHGVTFVREINESGRKPGYSWFMVADPDGNLVQVFGPTP